MDNQLDFMTGRVTAGKMTRREFMGKATALGVSAVVASNMFADAVYAAGPVKGGSLKAAMNGGASSDTLDPALVASEGTHSILRQWSDNLVDVSNKGEVIPRLAESIESSRMQKPGISRFAKA